MRKAPVQKHRTRRSFQAIQLTKMRLHSRPTNPRTQHLYSVRPPSMAKRPLPRPRPASRARVRQALRDDVLDSGLRGLFTEASKMDPQMEQLLKHVEYIGADELSSQLQDFLGSLRVT